MHKTKRQRGTVWQKRGICLFKFYTFGTSLTLLFWKVEGKEKSVARAFAWIPSAERKKCLAALLVETTSTWFQVPSLLPIVLCRPIVISLLFFFLQIERKWMDAHCPLTMKLIFLLASPEEKKGCSVQLCHTRCDVTSLKLHNLRVKVFAGWVEICSWQKLSQSSLWGMS